MANFDGKTTILLHIQKYCVEIEDNFKFFGTQIDNIPKLNALIQKKLDNIEI